MPLPPKKRQRTDAASIALSKPFRSPMKNPSTTSIVGTLTPLLAGSSHPEVSETFPQPSSMPLSRRGPRIVSLTGPNLDPDIANLTKTQLQLEKRLRELKKDLDTIEQARRIELDSEKKNPGGKIDEELTQLMLRWRAASRQAAEELFTSVRDRVNRMGGPKAWRLMQDRQKEFQSGWDTGPAPQTDLDDEDERDEEKRNLYAEYDIDLETANEKEARGGNKIPEEEGTEDEFTMSMMLRSLNVTLSTIGYDRENQRWAEQLIDTGEVA